MNDYKTTMEGTEWLDQCLEVQHKHDKLDAEDEKVETIKCKPGCKPHSTPLTLKWLEENYEIAEGVCIPRSTLYLHYLDFCEKNDSNPINAASFGKIIRQQFPQITTRRLGTRGQSKYHYYGIGVRESSIYYDVMYSSKAIQTVNDGKKDCNKQVMAYSPRSKLGTLLPDFPDVKEIKLPANIEEEKVATFLVMYRTHCQRILDTVIRANFDEVQSFLSHFWQGMPSHIVPIMDSPTIVMLVGVCDSIMYKAISSVLMPTVLQALPESLTQVIRRFSKQLEEWLFNALTSMPDLLKKVKFDLARRFAQVLRRQTSLNHLCQAARTVIQSTDITTQMLDDWLNIDLNSIIKQTLYTMDQYTDKDHMIIVNLCSEFEKLLEEQSPIECYIEWLDSMVDKCVVQPSTNKSGTLRKIARQFLLMWSCFGTRVIRDMTLHSAPSFGSFHLLHLMFDDYVLYLVESLHGQEKGNDFLRTIQGEDTGIILENMFSKTNMSGAEKCSSINIGNQNRCSVITSTKSSLVTNSSFSSALTQEDVQTAFHQQTEKMMESPPGRGLTAEGSLSSVYTSCGSFESGYGHQRGPSVKVSGQQNFEVSSSQLYEEPIRSSAHSDVRITDWTRTNQTGSGDNMAVIMRMNEGTGYQSYSNPRQGLYEYNGYNYNPNSKQVDTQYSYNNYSSSGDFYNVSYPENSKRRSDGDQYPRPFKRQNKEQFYFETVPNNFSQI